MYDWLRGSGTQVGEGVSVRALNFKQLHKFLSSTGDKKLNEVRLCLEGMPGYYLEENSGTWQRLIYRLLPSANQDPIGTIMGPGFASTGIIVCSSYHLADNALSTRAACITVLRSFCLIH